MKREIKFRVWDEFANEMIYINDFYFFEEQGIRDSNECKLMQFTGLKDKNSKEIYEGDVIAYRQHYFNICEEAQLNYPRKIKEVRWNCDRWNIFETRAGESDIEIIGNIYENSELLNN